MTNTTFPTSVRVSANNKGFLKSLSKSFKISESELINKAIDMYRKYKLSQEMQEEAIEDTLRDKNMANEDFNSYKRIINEAESI